MKHPIRRLIETSWLSAGIKVNFNLRIVNDAITSIHVIYDTNPPPYYYTQSLSSLC
ncbi:MAG: hypothetical protein KME55_26840 [Nostoc indistinguendum CM1-VF10]|jgi:hypothetical protein|nr:hypothetical protein [Nostoc indistinguendum CM1-VF10]